MRDDADGIIRAQYGGKSCAEDIMGAHKWWPRNWADGIMWVWMDCLWRWPYGPKCGGQNGHAETSPMVPKAVRPDLYDPKMPSTHRSHLRNILMTCNPFRMRFQLVLLPPWWYCHAKTVLKNIIL